MLLDPQTKKPVRTYFKFEDTAGGKRVRAGRAQLSSAQELHTHTHTRAHVPHAPTRLACAWCHARHVLLLRAGALHARQERQQLHRAVAKEVAGGQEGGRARCV